MSYCIMKNETTIVRANIYTIDNTIQDGIKLSQSELYKNIWYKSINLLLA